MLAAMVRRDRPELMAWVTPENEPGLSAAVNGMNDLEGLGEAVANCPVPVALWIGEDDAYHAATAAFARANGFPLIALPGDHISTLEQHGAEAARRVSEFTQRADRR